MNFWLTVAGEMKRNPLMIVIIAATAGYGFKTYAQKVELSSVESNFQTEMVALRVDVGVKFKQIERRISVGQAEAERTNIESQLRVIDVEVFNLELIAASSNQPAKIGEQIVKYSSEKSKLLRELVAVEQRIQFNTER
jgi:hypothetical protein